MGGAGGYEIGLSASASSGANAGSGDFNVTGGATARSNVAWIVGGVVVLLGAITFLILRR